ncbi:MAG: hypothetical protein ACYTF1_18090 [Planctomycetota bacterium]|jgi:hypothetical protein
MKMRIFVLILLIISIANPVIGATRFYLPSSGAAAVSPVFTTAGWGDTATATPDRIRCVINTIGTTMTDKTFTDSGSGTYLNRQYVSDPIAGQTISNAGTVKGQLRGYVTTDRNVVSAITIRVVSNDGATVRGTLLTLTSAPLASEYLLAYGNRYTPASTTLTNTVVAQNGDRIVIEVGFDKGANGSSSLYHSFGDDNATDLPEAEAVEANPYNPWVEFSQDIIFPSVTLIE